jgi:hypothetical protein
MLQRLIVLAAIVGAIYWYWSGPYRERVHPDYEAVLKENDDKMAQCVRGAAYKRGATGRGPDSALAQQQCAEKLNVYESGGRWHSYKMTRPD